MSRLVTTIRNVPREHGGTNEPALVIANTTMRGNRNMVVVPLSVMHEFMKEGDIVDGVAVYARAREYAEILFDGVYTQHEAFRVGDIVLKHIDDVIRFKPDPVEKRRDIENKMDRAGLKVTMNGETVLDAN